MMELRPALEMPKHTVPGGMDGHIAWRPWLNKASPDRAAVVAEAPGDGEHKLSSAIPAAAAASNRQGIDRAGYAWSLGVVPRLADVVHFASLGHPSLLHHSSSIEGGELKPLEQVKPPIKGDLPAVVGGDAAGMEVGAGINLPGERRAGAGEGVLHLAEILHLFFERLLIRAGDQVNGHLIADRGDLIHHAQELLEKRFDHW